MTYQEIVSYLYAQLPAFQHSGKKALKPSLSNIKSFCEYLGNPHLKFKSIHVAGTNGKGSSSHMLASILQEAGYKTGLYTSPHLKDFRERFRINGEMASESFVIDFVEKHKNFIEDLKPSFFEVTVGMAFQLFAENKVDFAIIETGLGGRLDSTNIITPILSLITNIGLDHTDILGDTIEKIASEKAGIIKEGIPVVISESQNETKQVFEEIAILKNAPIFFAQEHFKVVEIQQLLSQTNYLVDSLLNKNSNSYRLDLIGQYQIKNLIGVLKAIEVLSIQYAIFINNTTIQDGLANVKKNTGLKGRWQVLQKSPLMVCDTGHNAHAFSTLIEQINSYSLNNSHFVLGFAQDKDLEQTLGILPKEASYYFAPFNSFRARNRKELETCANNFNISNYSIYSDVNEAIKAALEKADKKDFIFIGGSTYLVAEIENL
jgi:dihydrofolate synthase / folylpolyglutamate synthase